MPPSPLLSVPYKPYGFCGRLAPCLLQTAGTLRLKVAEVARIELHPETIILQGALYISVSKYINMALLNVHRNSKAY